MVSAKPLVLRALLRPIQVFFRLVCGAPSAPSPAPLEHRSAYRTKARVVRGKQI